MDQPNSQSARCRAIGEILKRLNGYTPVDWDSWYGPGDEYNDAAWAASQLNEMSCLPPACIGFLCRAVITVHLDHSATTWGGRDLMDRAFEAAFTHGPELALLTAVAASKVDDYDTREAVYGILARESPKRAIPILQAAQMESLSEWERETASEYLLQINGTALDSFAADKLSVPEDIVEAIRVLCFEGKEDDKATANALMALKQASGSAVLDLGLPIILSCASAGAVRETALNCLQNRSAETASELALVLAKSRDSVSRDWAVRIHAVKEGDTELVGHQHASEKQRLTERAISWGHLILGWFIQRCGNRKGPDQE
jgi:hypothetical protein